MLSEVLSFLCDTSGLGGCSCGGQTFFIELAAGIAESPDLGPEVIWKMSVSPDLTPILDMDLSLSEISRGFGGKPSI